MIKELTKSDFENEVLKSDKKTLVDFNADWCGPCQMLHPILEEVSNEIENVNFFSVNIDDEEELAEQYDVISIPCLVVFENGKEVKRDLGMMPKKKILKLLGEK
jgi:thioredoxin 1